jgi:hypothetical protein
MRSDEDFVFLLQVTTACRLSEVVVSPDGKSANYSLHIRACKKGRDVSGYFYCLRGHKGPIQTKITFGR